MGNDKNALQQRMEDLGWTHHRLAQEVSANDPEGRTTISIYSAVRRVVKNPETAKLETLRRVTAALGGEVVVQWAPIEGKEVKL